MTGWVWELSAEMDTTADLQVRGASEVDPTGRGTPSFGPGTGGCTGVDGPTLPGECVVDQVVDGRQAMRDASRVRDVVA